MLMTLPIIWISLNRWSTAYMKNLNYIGHETSLESKIDTGEFLPDARCVHTTASEKSAVGTVVGNFVRRMAVEFAPNGESRTYLGDTKLTFYKGKACYIKDVDTGDIWCPTNFPKQDTYEDYRVEYVPGAAHMTTYKNKLAAEFSVTTTNDCDCEVWRVRLENRSAQVRTIRYTAYIRPRCTHEMEVSFLEDSNTAIMRSPLGLAAAKRDSFLSRDSVMFFGSTLKPVHVFNNADDFTGPSGDVTDPSSVKIDTDSIRPEDGTFESPVFAFTVEVEMPIEGEAEFGFCFGIAENPEKALSIAGRYERQEDIAEAFDATDASWKEVCMSLQVHTHDPVFDALVNSWLPYEAFAHHCRTSGASHDLDPLGAIDTVRKWYGATGALREGPMESVCDFLRSLAPDSTYSPDGSSMVSVGPGELLWIARVVGKWLASTGEKETALKEIRLNNGPVMDIYAHCERVLRLAYEKEHSDWTFEKLLEAWQRDDFGGVDLKSISKHDKEKKSNPLFAPDPRIPDTRLVELIKSSNILSDMQIKADIMAMDELADSAYSASARASALYLACVERILGITCTPNGTIFDPHLPSDMDRYYATMRLRGCDYDIRVVRATDEGLARPLIIVDGEQVMGNVVPVFEDNTMHTVQVVIPKE